MRRVECWVCGEPIPGEDDETLRRRLSIHLLEDHGTADPGEVHRWVERTATGGDMSVLKVFMLGRVLAGAAAVSFVLLAVLRPDEPRTAELLLYGGLAALAGGVVCALTLLGRLLER